MSEGLSPFHLAIPVDDLDAARAFYGELLGCSMGRTSDRWLDFDFFGHQVTVHLVTGGPGVAPTNPVDGDQVPARHFGMVLPWDRWHALEAQLRAAGTRFLIEPHIRFEGEVGEQATLFTLDPSGNALEFKSFRNPAMLFAT